MTITTILSELSEFDLTAGSAGSERRYRKDQGENGTPCGLSVLETRLRNTNEGGSIR